MTTVKMIAGRTVSTSRLPRHSDAWPLAANEASSYPPAVPAAQSKAHHADLLGEMVGGITHDFRNVLTIIRSAISLATRASTEPGAAESYLQSAQKSIDRGLLLTSRLLSLARPQGLDLRAANITELVRELSPFLGYAAGPEMAVRLDLCDEAPDCLIDVPLFNATLINLVVNARDASADGAEIRVKVERVHRRCATERGGSGSWVRVSVADDGEGMPPETLAQIFEPWFTTKQERGTGLGLPQVCALMKLVRGDVTVRSEEGRGTIFELYFPISGSEAAFPIIALGSPE